MQIKPLFGTATIAAGPTAVQLGTPPANAINPVLQVSRIKFQAVTGNAAAVLVGNKAGQSWALTTTGFPLELEASDNDFFNLWDFYVDGTAADKVSFVATPCNR